MVEAADVDGDLVPMTEAMHGARAAPAALLSEVAEIRSGPETWPKDFAETAGESLGAGANGHAEREHSQHERTS